MNEVIPEQHPNSILTSVFPHHGRERRAGRTSDKNRGSASKLQKKKKKKKATKQARIQLRKTFSITDHKERQSYK